MQRISLMRLQNGFKLTSYTGLRIRVGFTRIRIRPARKNRILILPDFYLIELACLLFSFDIKVNIIDILIM